MGQRIDVKHLNIYYGDFLAVEDVNINIEPNKVTAFIGPSGCGKSTVLRSLDNPGIGLSGGQQQRLCIARAVAVHPQVLLMDEPCSALDPISTLAVEDLINELKGDYTIVIVTHNMQQAARIADYTAFFNLKAVGEPGHLEYFADTTTMFNNPQNAEAERYISGRFG